MMVQMQQAMAFMMQKMENMERNQEQMVKLRLQKKEVVEQKERDSKEEVDLLSPRRSPVKSEMPVRVVTKRESKAQMKREEEERLDGYGSGGFEDDSDRIAVEEEEAEDSHVYGSYVEWATERERLFPFRDRAGLYSGRFTLRSHNGRLA